MTNPHPNSLASVSRRHPTLSALIPVCREDPCGLIGLLHAEALRKNLFGRIEVLVFDDGSADPALSERILAALAPFGSNGRLLSTSAALGRAAARNRLAAAALGGWSLYLDADMRPAADDFLSKWLEVIAQGRPWIALGGAVDPSTRSGAVERRLAPAPAPETAGRLTEPAASLLVHCDILAREPFDESFLGQGWEDVEWAARARRHAPILLIDAPATRAVPADDEAARERCRSAARNFARLVRRRPDFARFLPSFWAAQLFAVTPGLTQLRPLLERAARRTGPMTPPALRTLAAELWRASWYGEALR